jgi:hypothetical protein
LIGELIKRVKAIENDEIENEHGNLAFDLLGLCLANEIQINPELLINALEWYIKKYNNVLGPNHTELLLKSKFKEEFRRTCERLISDRLDDQHAFNILSILEIFLEDREDLLFNEVQKFNSLILDEKNCKLIAIARIVRLMTTSYDMSGEELGKFEFNEQPDNIKSQIISLHGKLILLLNTNDEWYIASIVWANVWLTEAVDMAESFRNIYIDKALNYWMFSKSKKIVNMSAWFLKLLITKSCDYDFLKKEKLRDFVQKISLKPRTTNDKTVILLIGYHLGMWSKNIFNKLLREALEEYRHSTEDTYREVIVLKQYSDNVLDK